MSDNPNGTLLVPARFLHTAEYEAILSISEDAGFDVEFYDDEPGAAAFVLAFGAAAFSGALVAAAVMALLWWWLG